MDVRFRRVDFNAIRDAVIAHLTALPSAIDSFLEAHILESNHYQIIVDNHDAGVASIHEQQLITQFSVVATYGRYGQAIFRSLRELEHVQAAFVPTCDEFYVSHALDDYRHIKKQAFFFTHTDLILNHPLGFILRQATLDDQTIIRHHSADFFGDIEKYIQNQALFLIERDNQLVGFGLIENSTLYHAVASIGMYVIEQYRQQGVGTAIIQLLMNWCHQCGFRPIAGCWYYNHNSKKTLERAGMFTKTRLLRIEY